jgi:hypothetical protein
VIANSQDQNDNVGGEEMLLELWHDIDNYICQSTLKNTVLKGKELEISGIQDVRLKYKQNWFNHLERMDNARLPKHALNYKP